MSTMNETNNAKEKEMKLQAFLTKALSSECDFERPCTRTDAYIKKHSKAELRSEDIESYGLRNASMSFYPGKNDNGMVRMEYDNMLVTGATGSGKTVCIKNIISQLILRYAPWQVRLNVWDGLGVNFVFNRRGVEFVDIRGFSCTYVEASLIEYLRNMVKTLRGRERILEESGFSNIKQLNRALLSYSINYPIQVILIEEVQAGISCKAGIKAEIFNLLFELLNNGPNVGMYTILSLQPDMHMYTLFNGYYKNKGYVLATQLDYKASDVIFSSNIATAGKVGRHGKVVVRRDDGSVQMLEVPYYKDSTIKDICNKRTLPMGCSFKDYKLNQLYRMHIGV